MPAVRTYVVTQEIETKVTASSPSEAVALVADKLAVTYGKGPDIRPLQETPKFTSTTAREAY